MGRIENTIKVKKIKKTVGMSTFMVIPSSVYRFKVIYGELRRDVSLEVFNFKFIGQEELLGEMRLHCQVMVTEQSRHFRTRE